MKKSVSGKEITLPVLRGQHCGLVAVNVAARRVGSMAEVPEAVEADYRCGVGRLLEQGREQGVYLQPVVARYVLEDADGRPLYCSDAVRVGRPCLLEPMQLWCAFGGVLEAYTLRAEAWQLALDVPRGLAAAGVRRIRVLATPQLHPVLPGSSRAAVSIDGDVAAGSPANVSVALEPVAVPAATEAVVPHTVALLDIEPGTHVVYSGADADAETEHRSVCRSCTLSEMCRRGIMNFSYLCAAEKIPQIFNTTYMDNNCEQGYRTESDLIGSKQVPDCALYGVQTMRGIENFEISKFHLSDYPSFVKGLAITKLGAAMANHELGLLTDGQYNAIAQACREIMDGKHLEHFPVDMIQGGAGTSTNMNANEVIANRALEIMGHRRGEYQYCSPNDHVNRSQSTNDAYPTAIHLGLYLEMQRLKEHYVKLIEAFEAKAEEYKGIIKMGRTQLEDAVPMTLGQTFGGFAWALRDELKHLDWAASDLLLINMGGTAIGTGICAEPGYAEKCVAALREITGWPIELADDLVGATWDTSAMVGYSSALKRMATKLSKVCNDLRLLAGGPRCGLGEINLPAMQPGSSIMPGKVNPVIPEVVTQICYKVMGNDVCVAMASEAAQMELNAMEPVTAQCNFESVGILVNGMDTLRTRCVEGITANADRCREYVHNSIGVVTALNPVIGYKNSTKIAKEALETGKSVYSLVLEHGILSREELDTILAPENMIKPVKLDIKPRKLL